ncbi:nucleoprotein [Aphis craccivora]|uniref:Nucleoprotein n=1 Tax=Aphis craccivora TaxID=307492 RepID=A0A6G0YGY3_APHCR|nr:nucleoprotein [Aphis craccivora]
MYRLVPKAKTSKSAVTLFKFCESVPILICLYLKNKANNPIVYFELMETICKNYPRIHQYFFFFTTISRPRHSRSSNDAENEFISKVCVGDQGAINGSHIDYKIQMNFLILELENKVTVKEGALEAVKLLDEKIRQHKLTRIILWR